MKRSSLIALVLVFLTSPVLAAQNNGQQPASPQPSPSAAPSTSQQPSKGNVIDAKDKATVPPTSSTPPATSADGSPGPNQNGAAQLLRVEQGVMEGLIIHIVEPVYPLAAKLNHITGEVLLQATIGKDGSIHNLKVISGHPALAKSAVGAVKQWRYRPYLLKGEPVEVETTIKVQYHM